MYKTGGGMRPPLQITQIDEEVLALMGPRVQPIPNPCDSNADFDVISNGKFITKNVCTQQ